MKNNSEVPVTIVGFEPDFFFKMHPSNQKNFPLDYCNQFIEARSFENCDLEQDYPQVVEPGQTAFLADNTNYHYIYGPVSNECQREGFSFVGFLYESTLTPEAPVWRDATCDVPAAVTIPEGEGLVYSVNDESAEAGEHLFEDGEEVTVTAGAEYGYQLADDAENSWSFTAVLPDCGDQEAIGDDEGDNGSESDGSVGDDNGVTNAVETVGVADESESVTVATSQSTGSDQKDELAATGSSFGLTGFFLAGAALLVGGTLLIARRSRSLK